MAAAKRGGDQRPADAEVYDRDGVEFSRVLAFTDGVFAIAITLLVVGIEVPGIPDTNDVGELAAELDDLTGSFVSFFISFAVIGRYWFAHHTFVSQLTGLDRRLIGLNMLYLLFIAFLPFPTSLLGNFFENPLAISIYAVAVAVVSGMEVVLFRHARNAGLLAEEIPDDIYRWNLMMSLSPCFFFLLSIPFAFVDSTLAVLIWLSAIPAQTLAHRYAPEGVERYMIGR
jgi:uncharacterized membrane protein